MEGLKRFEALQAYSMLYIKESFATESDELELEGLTWERFVREMEAGDEANDGQFEAMLAEKILEALATTLAPEEQEDAGT